MARASGRVIDRVETTHITAPASRHSSAMPICNAEERSRVADNESAALATRASADLLSAWLASSMPCTAALYVANAAFASWVLLICPAPSFV